MSKAQDELIFGDKYPYDAPDDWWNSDREPPPSPKDWAHRAARGIISDLKDRRGIKNELANIGEDIRVEIVESLAEIIRAAYADGSERN